MQPILERALEYVESLPSAEDIERDFELKAEYVRFAAELPTCTPEEIRAKVRHAVEVRRGSADLVLFTSNTINPDGPADTFSLRTADSQAAAPAAESEDGRRRSALAFFSDFGKKCAIVVFTNFFYIL